jgi:hypothetical protein
MRNIPPVDAPNTEPNITCVYVSLIARFTSASVGIGMALAVPTSLVMFVRCFDWNRWDVVLPISALRGPRLWRRVDVLCL